MQLFLRRVFIFFIVPASVFFCFLLALSYLNKKSFSNYRVAVDIQDVFIGDSHVQMTINDSLLPNAINLSQNSETYKFSYYKLESLLEQNASLKRVYLGFGYHSLSNYNDAYIFGKYSKDISARYFFILPVKEQTKTILDNRKVLPVYFRNIIQLGCHNAQHIEPYSFLGFYDNTFFNASVQDSSLNKRVKSQFFYDNGAVRGFSVVNLYYLKQIIKLCADKRVELVLINTPIHKNYRNKIPPQYVTEYYAIAKQNNLSVLEFNHLNLTDSCFIPDGDHVSAKGAWLATEYVKQQMAHTPIGFLDNEKQTTH